MLFTQVHATEYFDSPLPTVDRTLTPPHLDVISLPRGACVLLAPIAIDISLLPYLSGTQTIPTTPKSAKVTVRTNSGVGFQHRSEQTPTQ